jgi:hypothetical protein
VPLLDGPGRRRAEHQVQPGRLGKVGNDRRLHRAEAPQLDPVASDDVWYRAFPDPAPEPLLQGVEGLWIEVGRHDSPP